MDDLISTLEDLFGADRVHVVDEHTTDNEMREIGKQLETLQEDGKWTEKES